MDFVLVVAWIGVVALQLADVTLSAAGVWAVDRVMLALRDDLQDAAGQRRTPEEVAEYRERLADRDADAARQAGFAHLGAAGWLWRRSPARLIPVVVSLVPVVLLVVADGSPILVVLLLLPTCSYLLALAAARASVLAAAQARGEGARHRREIGALIDIAAKSTRTKTAGLGDRVTRALQILREQQAGPS